MTCSFSEEGAALSALISPGFGKRGSVKTFRIKQTSRDLGRIKNEILPEHIFTFGNRKGSVLCAASCPVVLRYFTKLTGGQKVNIVLGAEDGNA